MIFLSKNVVIVLYIFDARALRTLKFEIIQNLDKTVFSESKKWLKRLDSHEKFKKNQPQHK